MLNLLPFLLTLLPVLSLQLFGLQLFIPKLDLQVHSMENFLVKLLNCKGRIPEIIKLSKSEGKIIFVDNVQGQKYPILLEQLLEVLFAEFPGEIGQVDHIIRVVLN